MVVLKFKDEFPGDIITEFISLKSKLHSNLSRGNLFRLPLIIFVLLFGENYVLLKKKFSCKLFIWRGKIFFIEKKMFFFFGRQIFIFLIGFEKKKFLQGELFSGKKFYCRKNLFVMNDFNFLENFQ